LHRAAILDELELLGASLKEARVEMMLIDTQNRFTSGGEGRALAERLGARYVYLPSSKNVDEELRAAGMLGA
jgi:Mg-chelatase subunit ChlD